jgi:hypothetical protein
MHTGYYHHKNSSFFGGVTVTVTFDHLNSIKFVDIKGRIDLDPTEIAKAKEDFQDRQEGCRLHYCHIVSVELAKSYIAKQYRNKDFSLLFQNKIRFDENPFNQVAELIYREFREYDGVHNRFNDNSDANEGQGKLRNMLRNSVNAGKDKFRGLHLTFDTPEYHQILSFMEQDPDLKKRNLGSEQLIIRNWNELLFIYEHCLIDYRVLSHICNRSNYEQWIEKGQAMFDELYGDVTHALRNSSESNTIVEKGEENRRRNAGSIMQFMRNK